MRFRDVLATVIFTAVLRDLERVAIALEINNVGGLLVVAIVNVEILS
jgi:hypothetical protein